MRRLELRLFGHGTLYKNNVLIPKFQTQREKELFIYLAMEQRGFERPRLQELFWPDKAPKKAAANLRKTISRLKETLGDTDPEYPILLKSPLRLSDEYEIVVDALEFGRRATRALQELEDRLLTEPFPFHLLAEMEDITRLFVQPLLDDVALFDSSDTMFTWYETKRMLYSTLQKQLLTSLSQLYEACGNYERAIDCTYKWIQLDELQEAPHHNLVWLETRNGRPMIALEHYFQCMNALKKEGIELSFQMWQLAEDIRKKMSSRPGNLTPLKRSFVGRREEECRVRRLLQERETQLITLRGVGGVGKTTFARHIGLKLASEPFGLFMEGIFFQSLETYDENEDSESLQERFLRDLSALFGLNLPRNGSVTKLQNILQMECKSREFLLILDNTEIVQDKLKPVFSWFVESFEKARLLVTSRETIGLPEEQVVVMQGFAVPVWEGLQTTLEGKLELEAEETGHAITLFCKRASVFTPDYSFATISEKEQKALVEVCRLCEGMPLAIELAAAWIRDLTCEEIVEGLLESLEYLEFDYRDIVQRHRSVKAAFGYSWKRLGEEERRILQGLTVFVGDFSFEAAEHVVQSDKRDVETLYQKSLVSFTDDHRLQVHNLLQLFIQEEMQARNLKVQEETERLVQYFATSLDRLCETYNVHGSEFTNKLLVDAEHYKKAWQLSLSENNWEALSLLVRGMTLYWNKQCMFAVGVENLNKILSALDVPLLPAENTDMEEKSSSQSLKLYALLKSAEWLEFLGDVQESKRRQRIIFETVHRDLNTELGFHAWQSIGLSYLREGDFQTALNHLEECHHHLDKAVLSDIQKANHYTVYASVLLALKQVEEAKNNYLKSLEIYKRKKIDIGVGYSTRFLGQCSFSEENYEKAYHYGKTALSIFEESSHSLGIAFASANLARIHHHQGELRKADELYRSSIATEEIINSESFLAGIEVDYAGLLLQEGRIEEARNVFHRVLRVGEKYHLQPIILGVLFQVGNVLALRHQWEASYPLLSFLQEHKAVHGEYRARIHQRLTETQMMLPPETRKKLNNKARELASRIQNPISILELLNDSTLYLVKKTRTFPQA